MEPSGKTGACIMRMHIAQLHSYLGKKYLFIRLTGFALDVAEFLLHGRNLVHFDVLIPNFESD